MVPERYLSKAESQCFRRFSDSVVVFVYKWCLWECHLEAYSAFNHISISLISLQFVRRLWCIRSVYKFLLIPSLLSLWAETT